MRRIALVMCVISLVSGITGAQNAPRDRSTSSAEPTLLDVHGAGAQRSDPKTGDPADYPSGHGPQGDVIRIFNYARPVRSISSPERPYTIVDTAQITFFDERAAVSRPGEGDAFYGQDAHYSGVAPQYRDNGDGTVSDEATGLMWQQDAGAKMSWSEALAAVRDFTLGGYDDWRLPSINELYSLMDFRGRDVSVSMQTGSGLFVPFLDTEFFAFEYGDESAGERIIDSQFLSSTQYVSTTMGGDETVFGVNFADGRIKGYPIETQRGGETEFFVLFVRGNESYGTNDFIDNGDGTVTDLATGLMWLKDDHGPMEWAAALEWAEALEVAGYDDWRVPDAKELQSIVDYTRSPATTDSAAIDPIFSVSSIIDEGGETNYPFYWSSTTHADSEGAGRSAVYVAFGEALGFMGGASNRGNGGGQGPPSGPSNGRRPGGGTRQPPRGR
ncbi:MAG: DUF1566 domain-containing protein [Spirochaetales bacterium]|nr:DUF1566 domain-containing protein [Spirochaetales bacterium]